MKNYKEKYEQLQAIVNRLAIFDDGCLVDINQTLEMMNERNAETRRYLERVSRLSYLHFGMGLVLGMLFTTLMFVISLW